MGSRIAFSYLGCRVNYAEIEDLSSRAAARGWTVVDEDEVADVHVLNTCTVTLAADRQSRQLARRIRRRAPHATVVLMGCFVDTHPNALAELPEVDLALPNTRKMALLDLLPAPSGAVAMPDHRSRAFIKVQDGCDHRCAYCIVWRARGEHRDLPRDEVMRRVEAAARAGLPEVVLSGIDLGALGVGSGDGLAELVAQLLQRFDLRVRLGSLNPQYASQRLLDLLLQPGFCPSLHMPLQSGSERVLRQMNRPHSVEDFRRAVTAARARRPDVAISTDLISGFPGESDEDHLATVALMRELRPARLHVFPYSRRHGTAAARRTGLDAAVTERRAAELRRLSGELHANHLASLRGREIEVVWERRMGAMRRGISEHGAHIFTGWRENMPVTERMVAGPPVRDGLRGVAIGEISREVERWPVFSVR